MLKVFAEEICAFLQGIPGVKSTEIIGSLAKGNFDKYSDIDIEVDVSGMDNGQFLIELPKLLSEKYDIVYCDFAPSLAPQKYIVSFAADIPNPFGFVDISCVATPHCTTVTKQELQSLNHLYDHTFKLFAINLKHYLRKWDCYEDIVSMYKRICNDDAEERDEAYMLEATYTWLMENADDKQEKHLLKFEEYI